MLTKVRATLSRAQYQGTEPAEVLDREQLLLTPARRLELEQAALHRLLRRMGDITPVEFLRMRHRVLESTTQVDLYHCMIKFVEQYIKAMGEQGKQ